MKGTRERGGGKRKGKKKGEKEKRRMKWEKARK